MALFGRVPFGRANNDPKSIFVQIIYVTSIFLLILSACIITTEILAMFGRMFSPVTVRDTSVAIPQSPRVFGGSLTTTTTTTTDYKVEGSLPTVTPTSTTKVPIEVTKTLPSHYQFYLSVSSIVSPSQIGVSASYGYSAAKFITSHIIAAFISAFPIAICIERRRFAVDFILTIYGIYLVLSCIILQSFPLTVSWWAGTLLGLIFNLLATIQLCYRREMAEVYLEGAGIGMPKAAPTNGQQSESNNSNNSRGLNVNGTNNGLAVMSAGHSRCASHCSG